MLALLLPQLLLTTSPPTPTDFAAQVDHVGIVNGEDDVELIAYDHQGNIVATTTLWIEIDGSVGLLSEYADGLATFTITPDDAVSDDSTLPRNVVVQRAEALVALLEDYSAPLGGKLPCALSLAEAVVSCAAGSSYCPSAAVSTACDCLPKLVSEWTDETCPGFG